LLEDGPVGLEQAALMARVARVRRRAIRRVMDVSGAGTEGRCFVVPRSYAG
jgi:hypothetical protein